MAINQTQLLQTLVLQDIAGNTVDTIADTATAKLAGIIDQQLQRGDKIIHYRSGSTEKHMRLGVDFHQWSLTTASSTVVRPGADPVATPF